jgi:prevent-host-death family protein
MPTFNIREAKAHLSGFVDQAAAGQEVIITKAGKPVAKLVSVGTAAVTRKPKRQLGMFEGKYNIPDDFDAPLPADVLLEFYGPLFPNDPNRS